VKSATRSRGQNVIQYVTVILCGFASLLPTRVAEYFVSCTDEMINFSGYSSCLSVWPVFTIRGLRLDQSEPHVWFIAHRDVTDLASLASVSKTFGLNTVAGRASPLPEFVLGLRMESIFFQLWTSSQAQDAAKRNKAQDERANRSMTWWSVTFVID
jgi:hypothetical protein